MRFCFLALCFCLLTPALAGTPTPRFDPHDIVRQVRSASPYLHREEATGEASRVERGASGVKRPAFPVLDAGEFLIDTTIACYVPPPDWQNKPAIAFDGTDFLVVWADYRSGGSRIFGTRVSQAGAVLDPAGFAITNAACWAWFPAIAWNGANFLVVWTDFRGGTPNLDWNVFGTRVTPSGAVLDPLGFPVSAAANDQLLPAVAFDGTNSLVTWIDYRSDPDTSDIYGARVTPSGTVLEPQGIPISTTANNQMLPALASDGSSVLVAWMDYRNNPDTSDIYGTRVTPSGTVLEPQGIPISTAAKNQLLPALAFDGTNFLAVWEDERSGANADVYGARVSGSGTVLDSSGFAVSAGTYFQGNPAVTSDGANSLVVWRDGRSGTDDIYGARVTPSGTVLEPVGIPISTATSDQLTPALAFDGTNFLAAWTDGRNGFYDYDIYGARVTTACTVLEPQGILVSAAANLQEEPAAALGGADFLVVWQDRRSGGDDIYGARVTPSGTVIGPPSVPISTAADDQLSPALAFDDDNFLVAWQDWRNGFSDIYGSRVTATGEVLDPQGFAISNSASDKLSPAAAFDDTNFLVVWSDYRGIYGARVTPSGTVLDPQGFSIASKSYYEETPAVLAFDGTNHLVVWWDMRSGSYDIYGARVTRAGVVLDTAGIAISTDESDQSYPAVAFGGTDFLVVWADGRGSGSSDIYGARVTTSGVVRDPQGLVISSAGGFAEYPVLAFDGANFLVGWQDGREGSEYDIYGARVGPDGTVFEEGPVVRQEGGQTDAALCRGGSGQIFLVYQGWAGTVGGKTYNTQRIWGKMNPNPGVEEIENGEVRREKTGATIVRGVLYLPASLSPSIPAFLLDVSGRKLLALKPGPNDVSRLSPGVYFLHQASGTMRDASSVTKVVVAR